VKKIAFHGQNALTYFGPTSATDDETTVGHLVVEKSAVSQKESFAGRSAGKIATIILPLKERQ
jgi:hypothetical protein